jgi:hypothetical protein
MCDSSATVSSDNVWSSAVTRLLGSNLFMEAGFGNWQQKCRADGIVQHYHANALRNSRLAAWERPAAVTPGWS